MNFLYFITISSLIVTSQMITSQKIKDLRENNPVVKVYSKNVDCKSISNVPMPKGSLCHYELKDYQGE